MEKTDGFPDWVIVLLITLLVATLAVTVITNGSKKAKQKNGAGDEKKDGDKKDKKKEDEKKGEAPKVSSGLMNVLSLLLLAAIAAYLQFYGPDTKKDKPSGEESSEQTDNSAWRQNDREERVIYVTVSSTEDAVIDIPYSYRFEYDTEPVAGGKLFVKDEYMTNWAPSGNDISSYTQLSDHTRKLWIRGREGGEQRVRIVLK